MLREPDQPSESSWKFVEELKRPAIRRLNWSRACRAADEASLETGVCLEWGFLDPAGLLDTARQSMERLFRENGVSLAGAFRIATAYAPTEIHEAYRIEVKPLGCTILAADTEGIRRGIFWLEDRLMSADGPFLACGVVNRKPVIRTRLSRCFFGPILRPPHNRDELLDDVDYYPEAYLDRLAHDGVNGLWLTVRFSDLCRTRFFPNHGPDAERRLAKLRRTVEKCARFGLRIYPFCIEPRAFGPAEYNAPIAELERHPGLAGHGGWLDGTMFCTSSEAGQEYLEEATESLFAAVPSLGGLIMINLGERPTHCYSALPLFTRNNCPRCQLRTPAEVMHDTLSAIQKGMKAVNPAAQLISWLYVPTLLQQEGEIDASPYRTALREIVTQAPAAVIMQLNFESDGTVSDLGGEHRIVDYSLSYIGPSEVFKECARAAQPNGVRMAAKLQVGCSHEVATVPFVPIPGHIYQKYREMHALGVSAATQSWYFGNYPSLMTHAAGELSFAPLPATEEEFLASLARPLWGADAPTMVEAWKCFQSAYARFPKGSTFSYFGPVHDAIAWPLHLTPVDSFLARSWKLGDAPSGDRIGECIGLEYTVGEIRTLCESMRADWRRGLQHCRSLSARSRITPEQAAELGVAEALGLQIASACHVLEFYALRDELPFAESLRQFEILSRFEEILSEEAGNSAALAELSGKDTRLGFHSEAEGYKYFPEKLRWRSDLLRSLLQEELPKLRERIRNGEKLFPSHTGEQPIGKVYYSWPLPGNASDPAEDSTWDAVPSESCAEALGDLPRESLADWPTSWQALWDRSHLYIRVLCGDPGGNPPNSETASRLFQREHLTVSIEPRRLWPGVNYTVDQSGMGHCDRIRSISDAAWTVATRTSNQGWSAHFIIPWKDLGERGPAPDSLRINVRRVLPPDHTSLSWVSLHPVPLRLYCFGTYNPTDFGWLFLERGQAN